VRYVRHHAREHGIDGQRLAIAGASAGGLLALVTAMQGRDGEACSDDAVERTSSRVQAAGCFFPPTDLVNFGQRARTIVDFLRQTYGEVDPTFQFSAVEDQPGPRPSLEGRGAVRRLLRELSPVTHVTAEAPPTLLIHGAEDAAVPLQQSRRLVERLQAAQVAARLVVREGRGHAWPGWEADTALLAAWFDRHLRLLPLPPEPPWTPAAGVGHM
jgi:dipeptidyl aminopeptidase/acylaminoacyl peptidase